MVKSGLMLLEVKIPQYIGKSFDVSIPSEGFVRYLGVHTKTFYHYPFSLGGCQTLAGPRLLTHELVPFHDWYISMLIDMDKWDDDTYTEHEFMCLADYRMEMTIPTDSMFVGSFYDGKFIDIEKSEYGSLQHRPWCIYVFDLGVTS